MRIKLHQSRKQGVQRKQNRRILSRRVFDADSRWLDTSRTFPTRAKSTVDHCELSSEKDRHSDSPLAACGHRSSHSRAGGLERLHLRPLLHTSQSLSIHNLESTLREQHRGSCDTRIVSGSRLAPALDRRRLQYSASFLPSVAVPFPPKCNSLGIDLASALDAVGSALGGLRLLAED